jgi:hypothetical protein
MQLILSKKFNLNGYVFFMSFLHFRVTLPNLVMRIKLYIHFSNCLLDIFFMSFYIL